MDVQAVTESMNELKVTDTEIDSGSKDRWEIAEIHLSFSVQSSKRIVKTPEHLKGVTHYYFAKSTARILSEKLRHFERSEKNNSFGKYADLPEARDLKRSARYWLNKITQEVNRLKKRLTIVDGSLKIQPKSNQNENARDP